jgi:hypothetical protein
MGTFLFLWLRFGLITYDGSWSMYQIANDAIVDSSGFPRSIDDFITDIRLAINFTCAAGVVD